MFNFETSYKNLNNKFYTPVIPAQIINPTMLVLNNKLLNNLNLNHNKSLTDYLCGNILIEDPIAMAYAGHQFGHFNMLGDGRALLLGEHVIHRGRRFDIQLKGSGITPYSRGGDGLATVTSMLREYLYSKAMEKLNIKTSRSLGVILTNKRVFRNEPEDGAILVRVMDSHIRIGSFEYVSYFHGEKELRIYTDYVIDRHYKHLINEPGNKYILFFESVMDNLIEMVVSWLRVGFIHGVMNTDNMSITGETFDYGPCAFMNSYDLSTTFSSIDLNGRYSYGNQSKILKWNLLRLAEAILPIISEDKNISLNLLNESMTKFENKFEYSFYSMMKNKLGIPRNLEVKKIIDEFLTWLEGSKCDYTNTFLALTNSDIFTNIYTTDGFAEIKNKIANIGLKKEIMEGQNPYIVPRNYIVEEALNDYRLNNSLDMFNNLLEVIDNPYIYNSNLHNFMEPPEKTFDNAYKTFCNT